MKKITVLLVAFYFLLPTINKTADRSLTPPVEYKDAATDTTDLLLPEPSLVDALSKADKAELILYILQKNTPTDKSSLFNIFFEKTTLLQQNDNYLFKVAFFLVLHNVPFDQHHIELAHKKGLGRIARFLEINTLNDEGTTKLILSIYEKKSYEEIKNLLDKGACINQEDTQGYAPLDYAKYYRNEEPALYELLNSRGAIHSQKFYSEENSIPVPKKSPYLN